MTDLAVSLGGVGLRTPLVAASGTVGSVVEMAEVADLTAYGAAVAKSVSLEPWVGRPAPRLAPAGVGMLNGIGIQNPGIDAWVGEVAPQVARLDVPVWGSAVGHTPEEYGEVAARMAAAGIPAVELNLSCPNLEDGRIIALDPKRSAEVVRAVRERVDVPLSAKLSPNSEDVVAVAGACADAGADWLVLTNTVWGARVDLDSRRPVISGVIGGYSGPPLKPIALRCVLQVHRAMPAVPLLGCGGVSTGDDVVEYLLAGASAVGVGTVHFSEPGAGARIRNELEARLERMGVASPLELVGAMEGGWDG